jgi:hypothetical protein
MKRIIAIVLSFVLVASISFWLAGQANARALHRSDSVPQATWWHDAGTIPTITIENHATDFPIITAKNNWVSAGVPFRFGTCTDPNAPCIKMYTYNWGDNGYAATTTIKTWDGPPRTIIGPVIIKLNYYYGYHGTWAGYNFRLQTTMHEMGHAVGMVHDTSGGCMASGVDGKHAVITTYEKNELRSLYGL